MSLRPTGELLQYRQKQSMAFQPDILVTIPGEPRVTMVVEAKTSLPDLNRTEQELKRYMVGMQCPVGVLVTPQRLWLYRDFYTTLTPESVRRVGEYNTDSLWRQTPPQDAAQFERFVQHWLEDLSSTPPPDLPHDLREALREYILPAITTGEVRAAHPRPS